MLTFYPRLCNDIKVLWAHPRQWDTALEKWPLLLLLFKYLLLQRRTFHSISSIFKYHLQNIRPLFFASFNKTRSSAYWWKGSVLTVSWVGIQSKHPASQGTSHDSGSGQVCSSEMSSSRNVGLLKYTYIYLKAGSILRKGHSHIIKNHLFSTTKSVIVMPRYGSVFIVSKLVFYALSTSTVISGWCFYCKQSELVWSSGKVLGW